MDALRIALLGICLGVLAAGCIDKPKPYPLESRLTLSSARPMVWAMAPAIDLSGQKGVDPLLQADLVYQQLQEIRGLSPCRIRKEVYSRRWIKENGTTNASGERPCAERLRRIFGQCSRSAKERSWTARIPTLLNPRRQPLPRGTSPR